MSANCTFATLVRSPASVTKGGEPPFAAICTNACCADFPDPHNLETADGRNAASQNHWTVRLRKASSLRASTACSPGLKQLFGFNPGRREVYLFRCRPLDYRRHEIQKVHALNVNTADSIAMGDIGRFWRAHLHVTIWLSGSSREPFATRPPLILIGNLIRADVQPEGPQACQSDEPC